MEQLPALKKKNLPTAIRSALNIKKHTPYSSIDLITAAHNTFQHHSSSRYSIKNNIDMIQLHRTMIGHMIPLHRTKGVLKHSQYKPVLNKKTT
jgi:hypothetical protein